MAFRKLSAPSLKEVFVQEVEKMILSDEVKIGDKLPPEREMAESFGISLSIVVTGITELESKGFVEIRPRQGIFVADYKTKGSIDTLVSIMKYNDGKLSDREVKSLSETRIVIEQLMVRDVIAYGSDEKIKALERYFEILKSEADPKAAANLYLDFIHEMSIQSDNILLPLLYHSFRAPIVGMYERYIEKNGLQSVYDATFTLYEYVQKRDTEGAVAWVDVYLRKPLEGETAIID